MADQEPVNYVKNRLSKGDEKDAITKAILGAGWEQAEIDGAFFEIKDDGMYAIEDEKPKIEPKKKHAFHFRKLAMILVAVLVIVFVIVFLSGLARV